MGRLVDLGPFPTALEAEQAKSALDEAGIRAMVEGASSGTWLAGSYAMGLIRLLVDEEDAERATAILEHAAPDEEPPSTDVTAPIEDDDEEEDDEDDEPPSRAPPLEPYEAEAWARRTRLFAWIGPLFFWCLIGAIFRIASPPPGVDASPEAMRLLRQARRIVYVWLVAFAVAAAVLFMPL